MTPKSCSCTVSSLRLIWHIIVVVSLIFNYETSDWEFHSAYFQSCHPKEKGFISLPTYLLRLPLCFLSSPLLTAAHHRHPPSPDSPTEQSILCLLTIFDHLTSVTLHMIIPSTWKKNERWPVYGKHRSFSAHWYLLPSRSDASLVSGSWSAASSSSCSPDLPQLQTATSSAGIRRWICYWSRCWRPSMTSNRFYFVAAMNPASVGSSSCGAILMALPPGSGSITRDLRNCMLLGMRRVPEPSSSRSQAVMPAERTSDSTWGICSRGLRLVIPAWDC